MSLYNTAAKLSFFHFIHPTIHPTLPDPKSSPSPCRLASLEVSPTLAPYRLTTLPDPFSLMSPPYCLFHSVNLIYPFFRTYSPYHPIALSPCHLETEREKLRQIEREGARGILRKSEKEGEKEKLRKTQRVGERERKIHRLTDFTLATSLRCEILILERLITCSLCPELLLSERLMIC